MLRLVECYVQHVIGELPAKDAEILQRMTPKLQTTFRRQGEWSAIIAAVMEFDGAFDDHLKAEWVRAREASVSAEAFSRMVADKVAEE
jgi:hypothetical protein